MTRGRAASGDNHPVLVIDTAGPGCTVAVVAGGTVLGEAADPIDRGQAERLMGLVATALDGAGLAPAGLAAIVVCTGPGGFSGVRTGVAAARGLALGLGVPATGVDRFAALAFDSRGTRTVVLAAGNGAVARCFTDGRADGPVRPALAGEATESVASASPLRLVAAAAAGHGIAPPAPLYIRPPDALPSRHTAPALLP